MATHGADSVRVVKLQGKDKVVHTIPMAKALNIIPTIVEQFQKVNMEGVTEDDEKAQGAIGEFGQFLLSVPHAILSVFIDDLTAEMFNDPENGVTYPEFLDALDTAIELNRLTGLKNFLTRFSPTTLFQLLNQAREIMGSSTNGTLPSSSSKSTE